MTVPDIKLTYSKLPGQEFKFPTEWEDQFWWGEVNGCQFGERLLGHFRVFGNNVYSRPTEVLRPGAINIYEFGRFLEKLNLYSLRVAAYHLAMPVQTLMQVYQELSFPYSHHITCPFEEVILKDWANYLMYEVLGMRRNYGGEDQYEKIRDLHEAIQQKLCIKVEPVFCEVEPTKYAYSFDSFTLQPIGLGNCIWLNTGAHLRSPQTMVSKTFYEENKGVLQSFLFRKDIEEPGPQ